MTMRVIRASGGPYCGSVIIQAGCRDANISSQAGYVHIDSRACTFRIEY